ncbi:O-antigen ligase family protein [Deinococcus sp. MIMF12]|uniref:O-antigen ligase family protein n=1 Tax=Deinococcus rhizophilus TaxID=3049544 RepID=A0ABT7JBY5_9DEIO|nr:O-antigen ligase family protein [Deinococcus rhizophilus]MDL2342550.1 O-antigen ligase family protein [Deinococcus rhizophilus]
MTWTIPHPRVYMRAVGWREFALAAFLFAGVFKSALSLPFDLTVALAGVVGVATAWRVVQTQRLPSAAIWMLGLWVVMMLGLFQVGPGYGLEKAARFYTLTLLGAVATPVLLHDRNAVLRFGYALLFVGGLTAFNALQSYQSLGAFDRLEAFDANTIALGRTVGSSLLVALLLWLGGHLRGAATLLLAAPMTFVLVSSGSRGPLIAVALAITPSLLMSLRRARGAGRVGLFGLMLLAGGLTALPFVPAQSLARLQTFFSGDLDRSSATRAEAITYTLPEIVRNPLGVGFGRFEEVVPLTITTTPIIYPHNLLLEIGLEAGWLALAALVGLLCLGLSRVFKASRTSIAGVLALGLLLFGLVNALVSGDVNDNRLFWAGLALALTARQITNGSPAPSTSRYG